MLERFDELSFPKYMTDENESEKRSRDPDHFKPPHPLTDLIPSKPSDWGWLLLFIVPVILLNEC